MKVYGACGSIELDAQPGSKIAQRVRRAALDALALATEASARIRDAQMQAGWADEGRFDLGTLAALPMNGPEFEE